MHVRASSWIAPPSQTGSDARRGICAPCSIPHARRPRPARSVPMPATIVDEAAVTRRWSPMATLPIARPATRSASERLCRHPAGRRLRCLHRACPASSTGPSRVLLGARAPHVLRAGRELACGRRGAAPHCVALCYRRRYPRASCRSASPHLRPVQPRHCRRPQEVPRSTRLAGQRQEQSGRCDLLHAYALGRPHRVP